MKKILAFLLPSTLPTFAADPAPKPDDGKCKTLAECQKKIDDLTGSLKQFQAAYQATRQQRDAAQQALNDQQVQSAVTQATAAPPK